MSSKLPTHPLDEFNLPPGCIILKSSDGVEFKVYKNLLSLGSGFFETMFSLPQPVDTVSSKGDPPEPGSENSSEEMQVIDVSESSEILDQLLRFIYPTPAPRLPGGSALGDITNEEEFVKGIDPILGAAVKYEMQTVVDKLSTTLLNAAEKTHPNGSLVHSSLAVRVYVVACKHRVKDLAYRAAHIALKGLVDGVFFEDFHSISAAQYFPLVTFHDKVSKIMRDALKDASKSDHVHCRYCSKSDGVDAPRARWWNVWYNGAKTIVVRSPASEELFSERLREGLRSETKDCSPCKRRWDNWSLVCDSIKQTLREAISENDIDLSEI